MSGLESIVRPFVAPNRLATRRLVAAREKIDVEPAILSWGKAGTIPGATQIDAPDADSFLSFTVKDCDEGFSEISRKTTVVRVTQDGAPENFVDFNRIDQIAFQKDTKPKASSSTQWISYVETALENSETTNWQTAADSAFQCRNNYRLKPS